MTRIRKCAFRALVCFACLLFSLQSVAERKKQSAGQCIFSAFERLTARLKKSVPEDNALNSAPRLASYANPPDGVESIQHTKYYPALRDLGAGDLIEILAKNAEGQSVNLRGSIAGYSVEEPANLLLRLPDGSIRKIPLDRIDFESNAPKLIERTSRAPEALAPRDEEEFWIAIEAQGVPVSEALDAIRSYSDEGKLQLLIKEMRSLGWGQNVYAAMNSESEIVKIIYVVKHGIRAPSAPYYYHGTSSVFAHSIMRGGLDNGVGPNMHAGGIMMRGVGRATFSASIDLTRGYARSAATGVSWGLSGTPNKRLAPEGRPMIVRWKAPAGARYGAVGQTEKPVPASLLEFSLDNGRTWQPMREFPLDDPAYPQFNKGADEDRQNKRRLRRG